MARRIALLALVLVATLATVAGAGGRARNWPVGIAGPAQFDLTLAQVRFTVIAGHGTPSLKLAPSAAAGTDYVAAALLRHAPHHRIVALVLVVNRRPSGAEAPDAATVRLAATLSRPLAAPLVNWRSDAETNPAPAPASICALQAGGPLAVSGLRVLAHQGIALSGFGTRAAVAQGFDQACGRTVDPAFTAQVHPAPAPPAPTTTTPTPTVPPRCPPCGPVPQAGERIACPLTPVPRPTACPQ